MGTQADICRAVLRQVYWGPPGLLRFNVSLAGQIVVTGLTPTPESRWLMLRVMNPGPLTDDQQREMTMGDHDWLQVGWMGLEVIAEVEGIRRIVAT